MKRSAMRIPMTLAVVFVAALLLLEAAHAAGKSTGESDYVILGWNDLGMHCINPSYKTMGLLPPFNNLWVQVIKRGDPPQIVTSGFSLTYSVNNNTTVAGKSDFWTYGAKAFANLLNVPVPSPGVGLTGNGLTGTLAVKGDHFEATGVPVLPYDDQMNWSPYQIARVTLNTNNGKGNKIGQTAQVVLPVSDEIHCDMCHMQNGDGTANLPQDANGNTGTMDVYQNILLVHDYYNGKNGVSSKGADIANTGQTVLCANCHESNALGAPGKVGVKSVSLAMHGWHNGTDRCMDPTFSCYSCHPGDLTQCLRTGINGMGYSGATPSCSDPTNLCHGGIKGVADSITQGRRPWLDEPDVNASNCVGCHGSNYATNGAFRHAKGHGGVYCAACHNSPHSWWPSKLWADNIQPVKLQKKPYSLGDCSICHTRKQQGDNPHAMYFPASQK